MKRRRKRRLSCQVQQKGKMGAMKQSSLYYPRRENETIILRRKRGSEVMKFCKKVMKRSVDSSNRITFQSYRNNSIFLKLPQRRPKLTTLTAMPVVSFSEVSWESAMAMSASFALLPLDKGRLD